MLRSDAMLVLVMSECRGPVEECKGDMKAKLYAAMNAAKDHWMVLDKDTQFRGALAAVMDHYGKDSEEWKRLEYEINALRKISAFIQAAQAGLSVGIPESELDEPKIEPIGIVNMWQEVTKAA